MGDTETITRDRIAITSPKKAPISERKLQANRQNALKSTGPKTARGKSHSRYNALKHGILAKRAVIQTGPGREDASEFNRLIQGLREEHQPVGATQELLVEQIAICLLKKARVLRYEAGVIRDEYDRSKAEYEERHLYCGVSDLERSFMLWLRRAATAVELHGSLPVSMRDELSSFDSMGDFEVFRDELRAASEPPLGGNPAEPESLLCIKNELKSLILNWLDAYVFALENEKHELDTREAVASFPPLDAMNAILRYEASVDRQLQRALALLLLLKSREGGRMEVQET